MKPKAEIMKEMRARRKASGLLYFREWVTLDEHTQITKLLMKLRGEL